MKSSFSHQPPPPPVGGAQGDDDDDDDPPNDGEEAYGSVRVYGSLTSMPDNDYSRLSYYLKCCIIGCGIEYTIDVSLLDYQNAVLQLDANGREQIYHLVNDVFRVDRLLNRMIFIDDENILMPQGVSNVFYHFETASQFIRQANSNALLSSTNIRTREVIPQQRIRSSKVMLCSTEWLYAFYIEPISRLIHLHRHPQTRHPSPPPTATTYDRRLGNGRNDAVDDADTTPQPSEVPSNTTVTAPRLHFQQGPQRTTRHCNHCDGQAAACTCTHGCPRSVTSSHCRVTHSFPCNGAGCHQHKIVGPRYKYRLCPPPFFNLCRRCYHSKTIRRHHQQQHPKERDDSVFELIPRIGSPPARLSEMEGRYQNVEGGGNDILPDLAVSGPIVNAGHSSSNSALRARSVSVVSDEYNGHRPPPHLPIGQTVRLIGNTSLLQARGQEATILEVLDGRYLVHVPRLSIMLCVQANNMKPIP